MTHFEGKIELSEALATAMHRDSSRIETICREIFENPEAALEEQRASSVLAEYLADLGYQVETGVAGLPTAFVASMRNFDAEAMRKGLRHGHIAILAEYDAGEGGHLQGRHLVAGAAMALAAGLVPVLQNLHGEVSIIGCPAATTLEGKRLLAGEGLFDAPDLALGAAPASTGLGFQSTINNTGQTLASAQVVVTFAGSAGESDARQRLATAMESQVHDLEADESVQSVLSERGVEVVLMAGSNAGIDRLADRVRDLANEAARDTGSTAIVDVPRSVPAMNPNRILSRRIKTYADNMGLVQDKIVKAPPAPPDDRAYPSMVTGTAFARYPITEGADVHLGTLEFAEASISEFAFKQLISVSLAVGITAIDTLGDMEMRGFVEGELLRSLNAQGIKRPPRRWLGVHPVMPRDGASAPPPALGPLGKPRRG